MFVENLLINIITLFLIILTSIYLYFKYNYTYWKKENIAYLEAEFPFGNAKPLLTKTSSLGDVFKKIYEDLKKMDPNFGGFYMFSRPTVMIINPELVKSILTKDFGHFHDRNMFVDEEVDPLSAHLVALKGQRWRNSRAKITPTFTSGKIKIMFNTILFTTEQLKIIIDEYITKNEAINTQDIFARLTTDTIGSCAFGLDCNSLKDPEVEFRKYGKKIFNFGFRDSIMNMLATTFPIILKIFKIPQTSPDVTNFFMNVLRQTIEYREKNNIQRNDFLNLLIRLKNKQSVLDDEHEDKNEDGLTFNELAAHAFVFFAAGFETSSSTLNFCLFELVNNVSVQDLARKEVHEIWDKYGEFNYEAIMSMKYMDKVFNEVLRKYPSIPVLNRECTSDYQIPNSKLVIKKGTEIVISTLGMQMDPEHFPNPEKFDPERFSEEEKAKRHPYTHLPFGEGPRNCIGMRFALVQVKIVLAVLLKHYKFTLDAKTVTPITFDPKQFFLYPTSTFWLRATKV